MATNHARKSIGYTELSYAYSSAKKRNKNVLVCISQESAEQILRERKIRVDNQRKLDKLFK